MNKFWRAFFIIHGSCFALLIGSLVFAYWTPEILASYNYLRKELPMFLEVAVERIQYCYYYSRAYLTESYTNIVKEDIKLLNMAETVHTSTCWSHSLMTTLRCFFTKWAIRGFVYFIAPLISLSFVLFDLLEVIMAFVGCLLSVVGLQI